MHEVNADDATTDTRIADGSDLAGEEVDLRGAEGDDGHGGDLLLEPDQAAEDLCEVGDDLRMMMMMMIFTMSAMTMTQSPM